MCRIKLSEDEMRLRLFPWVITVPTPFTYPIRNTAQALALREYSLPSSYPAGSFFHKLSFDFLFLISTFCLISGIMAKVILKVSS